MNIGLLTTFLALGEDTDSGIGQHYRILADALAAQDHAVHVVFATHTPAPARRLLAELAPHWTCEVVGSMPPAWLRRVSRPSWPLQVLLGNLWLARVADRSLADASRGRRLTVIETHAYNAPALFFLRRADRPPVVTRVSTTSGQMLRLSPVHSRVLRWHAWLERRVTNRSDALVTHTRQHRDTVCAQEGYSPDRFAIVPHGLPDPGEPVPFSATNDQGRIEFLFVGRFESRKGIDVLLAALPVVASACPNAVFTLAGSHGDGIAWRDFARAHPALAGSRVQSLGRVPPGLLTALYQRCAVLVAPSRYESFGLIYPEAMSHGKPVIGCVAGGIPEVVTHDVTGLLAPPGDVAGLADCMVRLARDPAARQRMGLAARRDFVARFSADSMARNSAALYERMTAR